MAGFMKRDVRKHAIITDPITDEHRWREVYDMIRPEPEETFRVMDEDNETHIADCFIVKAPISILRKTVGKLALEGLNVRVERAYNKE